VIKQKPKPSELEKGYSRYLKSAQPKVAQMGKMGERALQKGFCSMVEEEV
jgi:hypothetical protein